MADTPNTLTINVLNNIALIMDALSAAFINAQSANQQWTQANLGTFVSGFTTAPLQADGLQSTTADPNPVATNPVLASKYVLLSRALSANDWNLAMQFIGQFITFMQGNSAVYASAPEVFAKFVVQPPMAQ